MDLDRRATVRAQLHQLYLPKYDLLCAHLEDDVAGCFQPTEGYRSFFDQGQRFAEGRTAPGPVVTHAAPGYSLHQYRLASDWWWFEGRKWVPLPAEDPRWQIYMDACKAVGLRCITWEKPHNEYPLRFPVQRLKDAFDSGGQKAVDELLAKELM